eukprot:COSAG01_NODE_139_length_24311_cov_75.405873_22_plen_106_part_00
MIVFDITSRESFQSVGRWLAEVIRHCDTGASVLLLGNKSDLPAKRQVQKQEAMQWASAQSCELSMLRVMIVSHRLVLFSDPLVYYEVSALDGTNLDTVRCGLGYA